MIYIGLQFATFFSKSKRAYVGFNGFVRLKTSKMWENKGDKNW